MKRLFSIFSLLLVMTSTMLMAQKVKDYFGVTDLKFNGTKYHLGFSHNNSYLYLQEYFPKGQTYEKYEDMFTVCVNVAPKQTPEMAVKAKEAELANRKKINKDVWNWALFQSPDGSEYIIDFICCEGNADSLKMIEFDVHKYRMIKVDGFPALQLIFYTHRVYGDDIMPFMKEKLADFRQKALNAIIKFEVDCKMNNGKK